MIVGEVFQRAAAECGASCAALDLSAGGLGNRAATNQGDGIEGQAVLFEHGGADRLDNPRQIDTPVPNGFVHEDEALHAVFLEGECCAKTGFEPRVALACGGFDVLRVMVESANDD